MAGSNPGYGRLFNDTHGTERTKRTVKIRADLVYYIANIDKCTPRTLSDLTEKSRPTITAHLKKLVEMDIIVEHSTSPRDPTKYYAIKQ